MTPAPETPTTGLIERLVFLVGVPLALAHLWANTLGNLSDLRLHALHFAGFAFLCLLTRPLVQRPGAWLRVLDLGLGLVVIACTAYLMAMEDAIYARGLRLTPLEMACAWVLIGAAVETTRRATGWVVPILIVLALSYVAWWGALIDGVFSFRGLSLETLLHRSIFGDDALLGNIARISATFVFMFILFGAFLIRSGAGGFIIDLAHSLAGRWAGGPGLVAVVASGLTGTISGAAVANTVSTGVITIPLMKRAGFPPRFAAGVEAAASTGGQLVPPIMGAGAFVMASYTQIPYSTIVAVSVLPAILYFFSVASFVRLEARRLGLRGSSEDAPPLGQTLRIGGPAFLIPIAVLIGLLVYGFTPTYAAGFAILAVIGASWLTPNRMGPKAILEALALGSRNMIMTAVLLCAVGLITNVIATAGIGNTFSLMVTQWSGSSLLLAITLVALASLVLGMGLPVTAAYIVLGTLSAPALYSLLTDAQLPTALAQGHLPEPVRALLMIAAPESIGQLESGPSLVEAQAWLAGMAPEIRGLLRDELLSPEALTMALLTAHLIVFWLSQDSNVTPPVCLCAFAAAAIAKASPMATGLTAWKIAKGLYVVPLLFAYTPLVSGEWTQALLVTGFALPGLFCFAAALQGYWLTPLGWGLRTTMAAIAVLLLWPLPWGLHLAGLLAAMGIWVAQRRRRTAAGDS
jgi:TRAP transporter 4TM/12TM fusion protein